MILIILSKNKKQIKLRKRLKKGFLINQSINRIITQSIYKYSIVWSIDRMFQRPF